VEHGAKSVSLGEISYRPRKVIGQRDIPLMEKLNVPIISFDRSAGKGLGSRETKDTTGRRLSRGEARPGK